MIQTLHILLKGINPDWIMKLKKICRKYKTLFVFNRFMGKERSVTRFQSGAEICNWNACVTVALISILPKIFFAI